MSANLPAFSSPDDEIARASAELAALVSEAEDLASEISAEKGVSLVAVEGQQPAVVKRQMAEIRSLVMKKQQQIDTKQNELRVLLEQKMREVQAVVGPMQALVQKLEEGIWSVNLYLGRDEQIVQLMDGQPAPADTPICVRQMVLSMDEECAVAAESGGLDAQNIDQFDAWLTNDPAHLEQVCPEQKGVVAFVPRWRTDRSYSNPWEQVAMDEANHHTYFLIRNGEKLFRIDTGFNAGKRLVPTADEFGQLFKGKRFRGFKQDDEIYEIKPGSHEYERAEKNKEDRQRHYMRVALILQGLLDRSPVFHPLHQDRIDFLGVDSYDTGRIVVITNDERAIGDGHEPFRDWQRRLNGKLRAGMRVVIAAESWTYRNRDWADYHRVRPRTASFPEPNTIYTIEETTLDGGFLIRYNRTEEIFIPPTRANGWQRECRAPKTKASCVLYSNDEFLLPFDLVTVEELERYLKTRTDRHNYTSMFPAIKATINAKRAEAQEEAPFRQMLVGLLATENHVTIDEADSSVDELIDWWKLANRHHRPLVGDQKDNAKAVRMIISEHAARAATANRTTDETLLTNLRTAHPDALLVARKRDGGYVLLEAENEQNIFVCETTYSARGGVRKEQNRWKLVGGRIERWERLYESERFADWDIHASKGEHLSDPDIDIAVAGLREIISGQKWYNRAFAIQHFERNRSGSKRDKFIAWYHEDLSEVAFDTDHLLTVNVKDVELRYAEWDWKRQPSGDFSFHGGYPYGTNWPNDGTHPWETGDRARTVYKDEAMIDALLTLHAKILVVRDKAERLDKTASRHLLNLEEQWMAEAENAAYRRFIDDYADPDLWEAHKKTLRINYPYHRRTSETTIWDAVAHLVEGGQALDGLTVSEAADRAKTMYCVECEIPDDLKDLKL